jgi:4-hydroxy-tetrahydrodipicolinate reductase
MTVVGVSGAAGRMGKLVVGAVEAADDLVLGHAYDPAGGEGVDADPSGMVGCDVVVEFTHPGVAMENLASWASMGIDTVVGTSGFSADRIAEATALYEGTDATCLIIPNFSIGAVLMMRFAAMAAPHFAASEVIELHHDRKADAPSGTSIATAEGMAAAGGRPSRHVEGEELRSGALGADVEGVKVHSVRLPGLLAHQEVLLGNEGELLTIRHDSTDRVSFLPGILLAIRGVGSLDGPVVVGLDPLLA